MKLINYKNTYFSNSVLRFYFLCPNKSTYNLHHSDTKVHLLFSVYGVNLVPWNFHHLLPKTKLQKHRNKRTKLPTKGLPKISYFISAFIWEFDSTLKEHLKKRWILYVLPMGKPRRYSYQLWLELNKSWSVWEYGLLIFNYEILFAIVIGDFFINKFILLLYLFKKIFSWNFHTIFNYISFNHIYFKQ